MIEFKETEHGLEFQNHLAHLWIINRPHYCDRGRVSWGQNGLIEDLPLPAMYFFDIEICQKELSAWMFATTTAGKLSPKEKQNELTPELLQRNKLMLHPEDPAKFIRPIMWPDGTQKTLVLEHVVQENLNGEGETLWVLHEGNLPFIDFSDQFPRVYRFLDSALRELDAFISCRLQQALNNNQASPESPKVSNPLKRS